MMTQHTIPILFMEKPPWPLALVGHCASSLTCRLLSLSQHSLFRPEHPSSLSRQECGCGSCFWEADNGLRRSQVLCWRAVKIATTPQQSYRYSWRYPWRFGEWANDPGHTSTVAAGYRRGVARGIVLP